MGRNEASLDHLLCAQLAPEGASPASRRARLLAARLVHAAQLLDDTETSATERERAAALVARVHLAVSRSSDETRADVLAIIRDLRTVAAQGLPLTESYAERIHAHLARTYVRAERLDSKLVLDAVTHARERGPGARAWKTFARIAKRLGYATSEEALKVEFAPSRRARRKR